MKGKVVTLGEALLRFSKNERRRLFQGKEYNGNYGGSEANVAVSLATLGDEVEYVTRLPRNIVGKGCEMCLRGHNVNINHVVYGNGRMGVYYFEEAAAMRNSSVVYDREDSAFSLLQPGMIDWKSVFSNHVTLFHCSGIAAAVSKTAADATLEAVKEAREAGVTVSFDINWRKNLWKYEGADAQKTLRAIGEYADVIFGDTGEYKIMSGLSDLPFEALDANYEIQMPKFEACFDVMRQRFPRCKVFMMALRNQITTNHHALTALLWAEGTLYRTKIYDIEDVIDPMGVGDAFCGALLHGLLNFGNDWQRCADYSLAAATLKNSIVGDFNLSTDEEINALMNGEMTFPLR